jgi:hypothetical protein
MKPKPLLLRVFRARAFLFSGLQGKAFITQPHFGDTYMFSVSPASSDGRRVLNTDITQNN